MYVVGERGEPLTDGMGVFALVRRCVLLGIYTCCFCFCIGIVSSRSSKKNPCMAKNLTYQNELISLCYLSARGDLTGIRALLASGADVNGGDYDGQCKNVPCWCL